jgi:outer membrane protein, heavy metal efflux system
MSMRFLACLLTSTLPLVSLPAAAETDSSADQASTLADQAVRANPGIAAVGSRIRALEQQVRLAGAWLDPMASVEYSNLPIDAWIPGRHPMSGIQLGLKQTFYWPGKIAAREEEARSRVAEEQLTLAERQLQLGAMVERAYYRLALVRQLRQVTVHHIKLVGQFLDVVRIRYQVGKVPQHDLLRLQVLEGKLEDDLKSFDRDDRSLTAAINAALHRSSDQTVRTPPALPTRQPPDSVQALARQAESSRPLLKRFLATARTRRAAARRASREGYPDITAWGGYRIRLASGTDPGTDFVTFGLSVPLPFSYDRRWGSQKRANEEQARALEQDREAEADRIRGELGHVVASWERAAEQAKSYREKLVPASQRTLDATFAAYQVGQADFASLFQAELQLLDFERTIRIADATTAVSRVEVQALIGDTEVNHDKRIDGSRSDH